jgi:DNA modification methylase
MELNKIYNEDCLETMKRMPDNFLDLTVTSPPYDNLRNYNGFVFDFESVAQALFRVTKSGGVVVWVVGDATIKGSETGTSFRQALYFKEIGFWLYDTMIWSKGCITSPTESRYFNTFEYMFILSKQKPKTLNLLSDRKNITANSLRVKHTNMRQPKRQTTGETFVLGDYGRRYNIWDINPYSEFSGHPAVFPEALAKDHILSWSNENDLIYDPFGGSGTTAKAAHLLKRNWILSEISDEYVELANKRLEPYLMQSALF